MLKRIKLDLLEAFLVGTLLVVSTWFVSKKTQERDNELLAWFAQDAVQELLPIGHRYTEIKYHSRNMEEWLIRDFFGDRHGGVFVDVGANHYRNESNTYFLETELGWSGIAIDALREFADDYGKYRPRTRFFALFVSDVTGRTDQLYVPDRNSLNASGNREYAEREGQVTSRRVATVRLTDLLEKEGLDRIDFLSMDIELAEPKALAGFDVDRFRPSLVCIESHAEVRQQILDYFTSHRYVVVGKYLRADPKNLYFTPLDADPPHLAGRGESRPRLAK